MDARTAEIDEMILDVAGQYEHLARHLSVGVLAKEVGMPYIDTYEALRRLRRHNKWPWTGDRLSIIAYRTSAVAIVPEKPPAVVALVIRPVLSEREAAELAAEKGAQEVERARVSLESQRQRCLHLIEMGAIDATHEVDQQPHGIPPRSNKDHAAWNKLRFDGHIGSNYERQSHKASDARVHASKARY